MSQSPYNVNKQRRLVDLNGDSKNFDLTFTCTSKDGAPFEVLVVDQATLDSTPNLQYKKANGTISGNIVADKNVYQNYFLVLKADKPCEVTVNTIKKDILPKQQSQPKPIQPMSQPVTSQRQPLKPNKPRSKWKMIAIAIVVVLGVGLLYYFYTQNQHKKSSITDSSYMSTPVIPTPTSAPVMPTPTPTSVMPTPTPTSVMPTPTPVMDVSASSGLLDRLKNLNMMN